MKTKISISKIKSYLFGGIIGITLALSLAFKVSSDYQVKQSTAEVAQIDGIYIFTDAVPVKDYNVLGDVSKSSFSYRNGTYDGVRDILVKRLKEQYPQANGGIFTFTKNSGGKCEAIRFKD